MDRVAEVADAIRSRDRGGDPERLAMKYEAMRGDGFAFFRATCGLYYSRLAGLGRLPDAPPAWTCGDLHLENFGYFPGRHGQTIFGVNDYDEALLAPAYWDVLRCASSLCAARKLLALDKEAAKTAVRDFIGTFAAALASPDASRSAEPGGAQQDVGSDRDTLAARTEIRDGKRRLRLDGNHALPATADQQRGVRARLASLASQDAIWASLAVIDIGRRIAGLGSLGIERYSVLVSGGPNPEPEWLIDLKGARSPASASACPLPQPKWPSEAERVATIEKAAEPAAQDYLTVAGSDANALILRQLRPRQARVKVRDLVRKGDPRPALGELSRAAAAVHANTAGARGACDNAALTAFGKDRKWPEAVAALAIALADENKEDWRCFVTAFDAGAFGASEHRSTSR